MADKAEKLRRKHAAKVRAAFGDRQGDFKPTLVTTVVRKEMPDGTWSVVALTLPPTLLAENVSEADAIEIQERERDRLNSPAPAPPDDE